MAIQRKQCLYLILAIVLFLTGQCPLVHGAAVIPGDARTEEYLPLLAGKRVALFCNQTARIGEEHILDVLLKDGQGVYGVFRSGHGKLVREYPVCFDAAVFRQIFFHLQ